jgi:L-alanine-DL-glutamate epimerase-like enolase superfamily enzyme
MQLVLHDVTLPLRHPFTISRGSTIVQEALIVELECDGQRGFGEASINEYYGITLANMRTALEAVRELVAAERVDPANADWPADFWSRVDPQLRTNRFAHCALDCAAQDLWGKLRGQPLWQAWGLSLDRLAVSDYTIGIDTIERMIAKLREFPDWPAYKIKLGTPQDLPIVEALRRETAAPLRVDANCGWTADEALANAPRLKQLGVELIEQPLPAAEREGARRLFADSPLPVFADESCVVETDVPQAVGHFHGVNIKLQKCGGLTPARRMVDQARQLGLQVMIGCMNESSVGISAAAQLLPLVDFADLDGAALLARDVAEGVRIERGHAHFPSTAGCGLRWLA